MFWVLWIYDSLALLGSSRHYSTELTSNHVVLVFSEVHEPIKNRLAVKLGRAAQVPVEPGVNANMLNLGLKPAYAKRPTMPDKELEVSCKDEFYSGQVFSLSQDLQKDTQPFPYVHM